MRAKRSMTAPEFEAVRPLLNISEDRISAARLALVEGQTQQGIANQFGWSSRQSVNDAVDVVWKTYERYQESQRAAASAGALLPPGWEKIELIAPSHLIAQIRQLIAEATTTGAAPASSAPASRPRRTKADKGT